eukprot:5169-Heterococcus_DN1.PRE.6
MRAVSARLCPQDAGAASMSSACSKRKRMRAAQVWLTCTKYSLSASRADVASSIKCSMHHGKQANKSSISDASGAAITNSATATKHNDSNAHCTTASTTAARSHYCNIPI